MTTRFRVVVNSGLISKSARVVGGDIDLVWRIRRQRNDQKVFTREHRRIDESFERHRRKINFAG